MARGFPFNDGDRGSHHTDATVCVERVGVGVGSVLPNGDGTGHVLLLLPYVQGALSL